MKNIIFTLSLMLLVNISCTQKDKTKSDEKTKYYDTGEVFITEKTINERERYMRLYFKNGNLMQEGMLRDSLKEGIWRNFYSDGVLKGEVMFTKNTLVKDIVGTNPVLLDFEGNPTEFKAGNSYLFRVLNAGHAAIQMPIKILGEYKILVDDENNPYTYLLTPKKAGTDTIMIVTNVYNEGVKNDSIFFPITVVE